MNYEMLLEQIQGNELLACVFDNVGSSQLLLLLSALSENTSVTDLTLKEFFLDDQVHAMLAYVLGTNTTIRRLSLRGTTTNGALSILERSLSFNTSVVALTLDHDQMPMFAVNALSTVLLLNRALLELSLDMNHIGDEGVAALSTALKDNSMLKVLRLVDNRVTAEGCKALSDCLKYNTGLVRLNLDMNQCGDQGAAFIAAALMQNTTLRILSLGENFLSSRGIERIFFALQSNSMLSELRLGMACEYRHALLLTNGPSIHNYSFLNNSYSRNQMTNPPVQTSLNSMNHIKALGFCNMCFDPMSFCYLMRDLMHNRQIESVSFSAVELNRDSVYEFLQMLLCNLTLRRIELMALTLEKKQAQLLGSLCYSFPDIARHLVAQNVRLHELFSKQQVDFSLIKKAISSRLKYIQDYQQVINLVSTTRCFFQHLESLYAQYDTSKPLYYSNQRREAGPSDVILSFLVGGRRSPEAQALNVLSKSNFFTVSRYSFSVLRRDSESLFAPTLS
jgi:hypothetical protein